MNYEILHIKTKTFSHQISHLKFFDMFYLILPNIALDFHSLESNISLRPLEHFNFHYVSFNSSQLFMLLEKQGLQIVL